MACIPQQRLLLSPKTSSLLFPFLFRQLELYKEFYSIYFYISNKGNSRLKKMINIPYLKYLPVHLHCNLFQHLMHLNASLKKEVKLQFLLQFQPSSRVQSIYKFRFYGRNLLTDSIIITIPPATQIDIMNNLTICPMMCEKLSLLSFLVNPTGMLNPSIFFIPATIILQIR